MNRRNTSGGRRLPSPKKRKPIRRHPNPFVQSDIEDAERTLKWLRKEDMSRELQWIDKDKGIPTAWYAAEVLAKQNGIRCIHREVRRGMDRRYYSVVEELKPITHFHGKRDSEGICHLYKSNDEYQVEILPDRSQKIYNHSPDGFEWGYGGSGPSQLSLAIMLEATDDDRKALNLYQGFKFDVVSGLPYAERTIPIEKIEAWITSQADDNLDDIPY